MLSDLLSAGSSQFPLPTEDLSGPSSSQFNSTQNGNNGDPSAIGSGIGGSAHRRQNNNNRPNAISLNLLNDDIQKVVDTTAVEVRVAFEKFLEDFIETRPDGSQVKFYVEQIKSMEIQERTTLYVDFHHVFEADQMLAEVILVQYYRMEPFLRKAVQNIVRKYIPNFLEIKSGKYAGEEGIMREFWVSWYNLKDNVKRLREIRTETIGQLVSITGTVTRTSEVRPELLYGTFQCTDCASLIKDVEQEFKFTEPTTCLNTTCNNRSTFVLQIEKSKFVDWQKVRIQENADEVPSGAMPRSIDVILRNEVVERAKAGDKIMISGTPIVVPDITQLYSNNPEVLREASSRGRDGFGNEGVSGLKALGARDLSYRLVFLGCFVKHAQEKTSLNALHDLFGETHDPEEVAAQFTEEELDELEQMRDDRHLYHKLVSSIAPHIFGHEDIKKGILLHLLGGVHKQTPEGIKLRGDINVCIVGDPSTAKSQFLKYVANFMPRAIYTSGKASSAAGLTASVIKDEETGEFTIEAGALMLADNGVCCIDEFDKMDVVDQVAIHEAMEQQTISITKAGIQATLNARTAILAAANPVRGRYDKKLSLRQNINMSPPIMSRFDLFFVILDECHESTDWNIARHIVNFHQYREEGIQPEYSATQLMKFLQYAKALKPILSPEAREILVERYRQLRQEDSAGRGNTYRVTVRQLESMIRLSEALAKLHFSDRVTVSHVLEAFHLLKNSIVTIDRERVEFEEENEDAEVNEMLRAAEAIQMEDDMMENGLQETSNSNAVDGVALTKPKVYLEADDYHRLTQQIILRITQLETKNGGEKGVRRSELIDWYLESKEDQMQTEEDLIREKKLIKSVLNRLLRKDFVLLELREMTTIEVDGEEMASDEDPLLTIHPNHALF